LAGPKQALQRIATTALLDGTYTAPASPCVAGASLCSYTTSYAAPYFKCGDPVNGTSVGNPNFGQGGAKTRFNATYSQSDSSGDQLIVAWAVDGDDQPVSVLTCAVMNATYTVNVQHTPGTHTAEVSNVVTNGILNTALQLTDFINPLTDPVNSDALRSEVLSAAVMQAVANTIVGSVVASDPQSGSITTDITSTVRAVLSCSVLAYKFTGSWSE
jgi:hypothetical protein